jgi:uncharacterized protein (TIGR03086 family)
VRELLNHMILWTAYSAERRARDEQVPDELMNKDFVAEPGYAADYAAQLDKAVAAWSDPAAWQRNLNVMGSPTPAADVAALLIAEMVLHGWDVAKASGQRYTAPDDVAAAVLNAVEANAELFRKYQGFADAVPVPRRPRHSTGPWPRPDGTPHGRRLAEIPDLYCSATKRFAISPAGPAVTMTSSPMLGEAWQCQGRRTGGVSLPDPARPATRRGTRTSHTALSSQNAGRSAI